MSGNVLLVHLLPPEDAVQLFTAPTSGLSQFVNLLLLSPVIQLLVGCGFTVCFAYTPLMQLMTVVAAASWGYRCACAFQLQLVSADVQRLAAAVCSNINKGMELWFYFLSQMSGIPSSLFAGNSAAVCSSTSAGPLLVLYANLLVCFLLPLFALFLFEYASKVRFLKARRVLLIATAWGPLLPLPSNVGWSCCLILGLYPAMLWHFLMSITPMLTLRC